MWHIGLTKNEALCFYSNKIVYSGDWGGKNNFFLQRCKMYLFKLPFQGEVFQDKNYLLII